MDNFEKQFKRKITIRKLAIDNMGKNYNENQNSNNNGIADTEISRLLKLLNENLQEADKNKLVNWHWLLLGRKSIVLIKKILRKLAKTFYGWLIFPIMDRQTYFNGKALNSVSILQSIISLQQQRIDLNEQKQNELISIFNNIDQKYIKSEQIGNNLELKCIELEQKCNELEQKCSDINNKNNDLVRNHIDEIEHLNVKIQEAYKDINQVLQNKLYDISQSTSDIRNSVDYFHKQIAPGNRIELKDNRNMIIDGILDFELNDKVRQIEKAPENELNDKLKDAADYYAQKVQQKIEKKKMIKKELIVIFCMRFKSEHGIEAIKNEAFDLFQLLLTESIYEVKLVSLEDTVTSPVCTDAIIYVDKTQIQECFDKLAPALIIICESTPYIAFDYNGLFIKNHTIFKLSGQNPLQGLDLRILEELRHCNDFGIHRYLVESQNAYNMMKEEGFREVDLSYPVVDAERVIINRIPRDIQKRFVVGFASSPMDKQGYNNRGIDFIVQAVKQLDNVNFKILWRNNQILIPEELTDTNNCEVIVGPYDMKQFYQEIDCILIPYKSIDNNHACSLSGIEAMINNIPVISTSISGIADIVSKSGMGIVCQSSAEEIINSIEKMRHEYNKYVGQHKADQVLKMFDSKQIISIIEDTIKTYFPKNFVTLEQWNDYLLKKNKYLVKGHNAIKDYYRNIEVANSYNEVRFLQYPSNYFDAFERTSINIIIKNIFGRNNLEVLDIASGDGRIVQEDIKHGMCTSIDSSRAMLDIVEKRFESTGRIKTEICDYFIDTLNYEYDIITTFRYIRHYDYIQRKILYHKINQNLKNGGILIFDAPNIRYAMKNRERGNWDDFNIYDVFWDENSIVKELEENDFHVVYLIPVGVKSVEEDPVSWTVAAMKY
jgi:glycosyltransferase involved in cell wall biosynthesis/SAM-dependent methyltransferase